VGWWGGGGGGGVQEDNRTYLECIRMPKGIEQSLERHLSEQKRHWRIVTAHAWPDALFPNRPTLLNAEHRTLLF
ncbi:MAG: hypothetical protein KKG68_00675, partial [Verrucomicrobia bacterium]|nr:hypothetical protein [Verrucomicrobiota bacterium]